MVNIVVKPDNFGYITTDNDKLFRLIEKSFTREGKKYNRYFRIYEKYKTKYYTLCDKGTIIKVKSGLIKPLCNSFDDRNIEYNLNDERDFANFEDISPIIDLNNEVTLYDYQQEALYNILKNPYCSIQVPTSAGKEQPISAKVLTPNGFENIGNLNVGDVVIAGDGKETKIIGKYPQGIKDVYKLTFSDNSVAECGYNHIWTVNKGRKNKVSFLNITLADILKEQKLNLDYGGRVREWKYEIPLSCVEGKHKAFYIHPYILGVLIADGSLSGKEVAFSCMDYDVDIINRVETNLQNNYRLSKNDCPSCPQYKLVNISNSAPVNLYLAEIKRLGLNVKSKDKFIPKEYLYGSSIEQRIELLQGLMDCDGSQDKNYANTTYSTSSYQLALDIVELVQSLGCIAKIYTKNRLHEGKSIEYIININIQSFCPFYLHRKRQYWKPSTDKLRRYIKRIELVRQEESVCIEVESDTKQYLTNNYIVTHNTEISSAIIKNYFQKYNNRVLLYIVPTVTLQNEAIARFNQYGIETNKTYPYYTGKANVVTYTSLVGTTKLTKDDYKEIGCVIFDECHRLKAPKSSRIVNNFTKLNMCVGLSATLTENIEKGKKYLNQLNEQDLKIFGSTGIPVYYKSIKKTIEEKVVTPISIHLVENPEEFIIEDNDWHKIRHNILQSENRNKLIADLVKSITLDKANLNTVSLLIPEIEWSKQCMLDIYEKLHNYTKDTRFILTYGSDKIDEIIDGKIISLDDEDKEDAKSAIRNNKIKTIFSATTYFFEGINIKNIEALINTYGGRSSIRVKQQVGRIMRLFKGKDIAHVFEIYDKNPILENQLKVRLNIYKKDYNANITRYKI